MENENKNISEETTEKAIEKVKKYLIMHDKTIADSFEDVVEAIFVNRTKHKVGSKVVRLEEDGSHTLLAQNKKILQNGRTVNRKLYKNNGLFASGKHMPKQNE